LRKLKACAAFLFLVSITGCLFGGHGIEPKFPTSGKKVAVIPFREDDLFYVESKLGLDMAARVIREIARNAIDMRAVDPKPAYEEYLVYKDPDKVEWDKVAAKLKADYVLIGHIRRFRARDPKRDVNLFRGEMIIEITVMRADNSIAAMETIVAKHPSGKFITPVLDNINTTEEDVLERLRQLAADKIGKLFYSHEPSQD